MLRHRRHHVRPRGAASIPTKTASQIRHQPIPFICGWCFPWVITMGAARWPANSIASCPNDRPRPPPHQKENSKAAHVLRHMDLREKTWFSLRP